MWGADWNFRQEGNCSVSRGLPSDAEQLSLVTEFSIRTEQPLYILFLQRLYLSLNMRYLIYISRCNKYMFEQEMFGSVPIYDILTLCTMSSYTALVQYGNIQNGWIARKTFSDMQEYIFWSFEINELMLVILKIRLKIC